MITTLNQITLARNQIHPDDEINHRDCVIKRQHHNTIKPI
jgi:hypothetical protein